MQQELINGDRRADRRHPGELELRFWYREKGQVRHGTGRTIELSKGGVRFTTEAPVPRGVESEVQISWPFPLQNSIPLELVMHGKILNCDERGTVLQARTYAFRTCGSHSFHEEAAVERSCNITA